MLGEDSIAAATSGGSDPDETVARSETGYVCLAIILKFLEIAVEPAQLKHQLGKGTKELLPGDIVRMAKSLGSKARNIKVNSASRLHTYPLPCIVRLKNGGYAILGQASDEKVLLQDPVAGQPKTLTLDAFEEIWDGSLLMVTTRAKLAGEARKFDISWFIPALVKYRKLLGEVLAASFFLAAFGAGNTPVFSGRDRQGAGTQGIDHAGCHGHWLGDPLDFRSSDEWITDIFVLSYNEQG